MIHNFIKYFNYLYPHSNDPFFIIAGVQKAGTTSLFHYLNQHPELKGSKPKELHYFNRDLYFNKSHASYRKHFYGSPNLKYFEATPAYIYHPEAMENIKSVYPNIKIIIILREPVSRAFSAWHHYRDAFYRNKGKNLKNVPKRKGNNIYDMYFKEKDIFPSFGECIKLEIELFKKDNPPFEPAIIRRGLYYQQLKNCFDLFPIENILILGFKELISNTINTVNKVLKFLDKSLLVESKLSLKARNKRKYKEDITKFDKEYLENYYSSHNRQLTKLIGKIDW